MKENEFRNHFEILTSERPPPILPLKLRDPTQTTSGDVLFEWGHEDGRNGYGLSVLELLLENKKREENLRSK